jgi:ligand-binding sensor domain-containing protein
MRHSRGNIKVIVCSVGFAFWNAASAGAQTLLWPGNNLAGASSIAVGKPVSKLGKNIDCIFQEKDGIYWFATNGEGVFRYDGKQIINYTDHDGLKGNNVWNIQQDLSGKLWFTTSTGVCLFDGKAFIDYTYTIQHAPKGKWRYSKGGLFFPHAQGICFYDGTSFVNGVITPEGYAPSLQNNNRPYAVYSILIDTKGNSWFGTQEEGVCKYDGQTFFWLTSKNLAGPAVRALFEDRNGNLWFGNNGGGLFRYDGQTLVNITQEKKLGNPEFLIGHKLVNKPGTLARVWSITDDREGALWVATIDAGLWKFDGSDWINYTVKDGLASDSIWTIFKNKNGDLWFVAGGETIFKFNGKTFIRVEFPQQ